jgi:hypothetical protein
MSSSSNATVLIQAGIAAAISAAGLVLLQTDAASRYLLPADRLRSKRRNEYRYRWQRALELAAMQIQYARAGGVQQYTDDGEKRSTVRLSSKGEDEVQILVDQVYADQDNDVKIARVGRDNGEVFVWLISGSIQYQVPLVAFVDKMEDALDRHVSTATFCFVSDASGGIASALMEKLAPACFADSVAVLHTPVWMVQLAVLVDQAQISTGHVEQVVSCLCRLHAHLHRPPKSVATIIYTVPTAVVPILSCWFQEAFPDDRHVFGYTGCIRAIEHAVAIKSYHGSLQSDLPSLQQALRWSHPVATTTPLSKRGVEVSSSNVGAPAAFVQALAALPLEYADIVEAWMAAVDAFCALKENEKTNDYLPYVFRLDYVYQPGDEEAKAPVIEGTDRYWSLRSLLQYITGSQNRELSSEVMDAAISVVADFSPPRVHHFALKSPPCRLAIDNAVFQHKQILIENKTLVDTVRPARHWTLKAAARKGGCSCCAPEEDDEEQEQERDGANRGAARSSDSFLPAAASRPGGASSGFVDGKSVFAFDPSRFS